MRPRPTVARVDVLIGRLRRIAREAPRFKDEINEIVAELVHLALELEPPTTPASKHAPGPRAMGPRRRCLAHNEGVGADVSASRFRPGRDVCRECERRNIKVYADTVALDVVDGDVCIGHECPVCAQPFRPGERVVGVELRHEACGVVA
jgi:hypothetical protein